MSSHQGGQIPSSIWQAFKCIKPKGLLAPAVEIFASSLNIIDNTNNQRALR